ncbi:MAG: hypothetical protein COA45_01370 [Zetaproteobacteria bacterium]|nr:MAG: hypothetical protein COA45_01370 [Zetaproteobacteria bacterium]
MSDGLVTQPSILDNLHAEAPFKESASGVSAVLAPMVIDPNKPISSLALGGNQFTIARDTNHGNADITGTISSELDALAQAGVKHIMFESTAATKVEMEAVYPELKGMSPKQADDYFSKVYDELITFVSGQVAPKIEHISDPDEWNNAYEKEQDILMASPEIKNFTDQLNRFSSSFLPQDVIGKWFSEPSEMTEPELRDYAHLFAPVIAKSDLDRKDMAENVVEIMIKCRALGMTFHDFGDDPGGTHWEGNYLLNKMGDDIIAEKDAYIQDNAELHQSFMAWLKDTSYFETLDKSHSEKEGLYNSLTSHGDKVNDFFDRATQAYDAANVEMDLAVKARFSDDALERRAQTYIDMAGGEKTLIFRGASHFDNSHSLDMDIDEYMDQKLRQQALQDGTLNDFVPSKQITLYPSRDFQSEFSQLTGRDIIPPDPSDINYFMKEGVVEITDAYKGQYVLTNDGNSLQNTLAQ